MLPFIGFSFVIPSILIVFFIYQAIAVLNFFGNNGFFNCICCNFYIYNFFIIETIYGIKAILIAHILLNTPFASRLFFKI